MLSRLETESVFTTELDSSVTLQGEIISYRIFDDVSEYMDVLWDQGAKYVEPQHLGGKRINLQSVWDNSAQSTGAPDPLKDLQF